MAMFWYLEEIGGGVKFDADRDFYMVLTDGSQKLE
jgi:hypothetical protein